jgi:hypothetical protein
MVFVMGLQKNYSPDVGFHLQSAKWMLDNKQFIKTDSFTYTSAGNNYYDLQWLYQLFIYCFYKIGKDAGLIILNSILIVISFALVTFRFSRSYMPNNFSAGIFCLVIIVGIQPLPMEIRPHVLSWIYLNIILIVLERYRSDKTSGLIWLPVIMLLWVNSHSLSVLGLAVIGIHVLGQYLESKKLDKQLCKFAFLSLITFLINPYFIEGLALPFSQLGILKGEVIQKSYIGELQSPFTLKELKEQGLHYFFNPLFYLQIYSIVTLIIGIRLFLKREIVNALLIFSFFIILALALKNYGYFLMISLPMVISYISEQIFNKTKNKKAKKEEEYSKPEIRLQLISFVLMLFISWLSITDGFSILRQSPYRFGLSVDEQSVPVEACNFLKQNNIHGKLLNHLDFGGYLMYNYSEKVFIDGRLELPKQEFFKKYYNSLAGNGFSELLTEYDPEVIVLPYTKARSWWRNLINNKNYRPVYFDGLAAVYLKNGKFNEIKELNAATVCKGLDTVSVKTRLSTIITEKKPSRSLAVLKSFWQKQYYPIDEQNKATFCFTYSFFNAALFFSEEAIQRATFEPKNTYYNLYLYFRKQQRFQEADICQRKSK